MSIFESVETSVALSYLNICKIMSKTGYKYVPNSHFDHTIEEDEKKKKEDSIRRQREKNVDFNETDPIKFIMYVYDYTYKDEIPNNYSFYDGVYADENGNYISVIYSRSKKVTIEKVLVDLSRKLMLQNGNQKAGIKADPNFNSYTVYINSIKKIPMDVSNIDIRWINYNDIAYYIPKHVGSSKYELLTDEEKNILYSKYGINDSGMIHITSSDPAIVQYGWIKKVGSVVRIITDQEMTDNIVNTTIDYRLIVEDIIS